ncbi:MAG: hypothetical protein AAFZ18_06940 [Myxococcota bacterium]
MARVIRSCIAASLSFLTACVIEVETQQVLSTEAIAPGSECPNGGQRVVSGVDDNGNGKLDAEEQVSSQTALCFPTPRQVLSTEAIAPGSECPNGGQRVVSGVDDNGNGELDAEEQVLSQTPVCFPVPDGDLMLTVSDSARPDDPNSFSSLITALDFLRMRQVRGRVVIEVRSRQTLSEPIKLDDFDGIELEITGPSNEERTEILFNGTREGFTVPDGVSAGTLKWLTIQNTNPEAQSSSGIRVGVGATLAIQELSILDFRFALETIGGNISVPPTGDLTTRTDVRCFSGTSNNVFSVGVFALRGGTIDIPNATVENCFFGFWALNASSVTAPAAIATENVVAGFQATNNSVVEAEGSRSDSNGVGYSAVANSTMIMLGWQGPPTGMMANAVDLQAQDSSVFTVREEGDAPVSCGTVSCDTTTVIRGCQPVTCGP